MKAPYYGSGSTPQLLPKPRSLPRSPCIGWPPCIRDSFLKVWGNLKIYNGSPAQRDKNSSNEQVFNIHQWHEPWNTSWLLTGYLWWLTIFIELGRISSLFKTIRNLITALIDSWDKDDNCCSYIRENGHLLKFLHPQLSGVCRRSLEPLKQPPPARLKRKAAHTAPWEAKLFWGSKMAAVTRQTTTDITLICSKLQKKGHEAWNSEHLASKQDFWCNYWLGYRNPKKSLQYVDFSPPTKNPEEPPDPTKG